MTDPKILIPIIRQVSPALIASDIIGVQPMQANTGSIFGMTYKEQTFTWSVYLDILQSRYTSWTKLGQECTGDGLEDVTEMMQRKFPGPYTIVEKFNVDRGVFGLEPKFESPQEELLWKIKWSS